MAKRVTCGRQGTDVNDVRGADVIEDVSDLPLRRQLPGLAYASSPGHAVQWAGSSP